MQKLNDFFKVLIVPLAGILLFSSGARAQGSAALVYSIPRDTSLPPVYPGQPTQVTTAYLWLDLAMRHYSDAQVESFIQQLTWDDTAKMIASNLYQMQNDDPLAFYLWAGAAVTPNPYKCEPSVVRTSFENLVSKNPGSQTALLLSSDIIADVMVNDTACKHNPSAHIAKDMVLVDATILDTIKGERIPACPPEMTHGKSHNIPLSIRSTATSSVRALIGSCLQFEYSPEWFRLPNDDVGFIRYKDSVGGWWVKPGHEYIVFLGFRGIGADTNRVYFTVHPDGGYGTSGTIYPVVDGIVIDPENDFGFGTGLTVADWKTKLRAKINALVNP